MSENKSSKKHTPNHLLRNARKKRGWTHADVADQVDMSDSHTVGRWERGDSAPSPRYQRELCRIFEMSAEELGFLLTTEEAPMWKMPAIFTSFIGREQEITNVCSLLERADVHLVTLLGPGGIGKTRLSLQIAKEMSANFADGACFISLATVRDPALVVPTIAHSLGIQESGSLPLTELVKGRLRDKHFLLLLDNFEQVASEAPFIEDLLEACPNVKAVVTSRAVLYLQAEHIFQVNPLTLPDLKRFPSLEILSELPAVALFIQRATMVQHDFQITVANAQAIAECCVHLDGLPLAIELAAARMNLFSPQLLLTRLSQGLHILRSELYHLPERQRAIYNTIKWSYDLLDERERWLFRQLSVFHGNWAVGTVEHVLKGKLPETFDLLDLITSLRNKSLLQRRNDEDGEPYFTMLETVREFGLVCLRTSGEIDECRRTHARYYLAYLESAAPHLKDTQQVEWLTRLERDKENLRAALEWFIEQKETDAALHFCEAFGKFCGLSGYWSEEQQWCTIVLALSGESSIVRARVLRRAGHLAYRLRDLAKARVWLAESVQLSRALDDKQNLAGALSGLAWTVLRQQDSTISVQGLLEESVEMARASGNQWSLANTLESLGRFMYWQSHLEKAHQLVTEGVALMRTVGDKESLARFLERFAAIELSRGNIARAAALAQESFTFAQKLGTTPLKALALDSLGSIALFRGDYEQATSFFTQRLAFARELGDVPAIAKTQVSLGDIALAQDELELADALVQEGLWFFRAHSDSPDIALALNTSGAIKLARGMPVEAWELYKEALLLDKKGSDKKSIGKHLSGLALVAFAQGQTEEAVCLFSVASLWINADRDMHPVQRERYNDALKQVQTKLGDVRFADAWSRGTVMTLDHALLGGNSAVR